MLSLPQVTLTCVDTRLPRMALDAMIACMKQVQFGEALLFTCPDHGLTDVPDTIRVIELDNIHSIEAYSRLLLKGLGPYLRTTHMLIVQWDGYVIDASMWRDDFLTMDYIGAVWPQYEDAYRVGNGGFSLRSRRLLEALTSDDIAPEHPEDACIARTNRALLEQRWGIRFADEDMAHAFAFERERKTPSSFGFHGLSNMALVLGENDLRSFVRLAPNELFASVETRLFIKRLIMVGHKALARETLNKRLTTVGWTFADVRLWLRLLVK